LAPTPSGLTFTPTAAAQPTVTPALQTVLAVDPLVVTLLQTVFPAILQA